jgi:hypothetical protein
VKRVTAENAILETVWTIEVLLFNFLSGLKCAEKEVRTSKITQEVY